VYFIQSILALMNKKILSLILIAFSVANCFARPVSYAGGYTTMFSSNSLRDTLYLHYSPTSKDSVGIEAVNGV
jgi:hypothetical protein